MLPGQKCCKRCDNQPFLDGWTPLCSERKFRLWCAALFDLSSYEYKYPWPRDLVYWRRGEESPLSHDEDEFMFTVRAWAEGNDEEEGDPPMSVRAALLRDVVGNPFSPLTFPRVRKKERIGPFVIDAGIVDKSYTNETYCPWLTPTVISLAQAAWDARGEDGLLDNVRMMVLADALQDAGCDGTTCEHCVDGDIGCPKCDGTGVYYDPPYSLNRKKCLHCNDGLLPEKCKNCNGNGLVMHPLVAHLRSGGMHCRGCHVLDLIVGSS